MGGGFPELFAETLSSNRSLHQAIWAAYRRGMPIYAECGGLMWLCRRLIDREGYAYPMVGLIPADAVMGSRLARMGYVDVRFERDTILGPAGTAVRGHVFHWSTLDPPLPEETAPYRIRQHDAAEEQVEGYAVGNLLASYVHLHFGASPELARSFVRRCAAHKRGCQGG